MINNREVHVGAPPDLPDPPSGWVSTNVHFHDFKSISSASAATSPRFECLGHQWTIALIVTCDYYPMARIYLKNMSNESIDVQFNLVVKNPTLTKRVVMYSASEFSKFGPLAGNKKYIDFARCTLLENYLVDGTLTVEVQMRTTKKITLGPNIPELSFKDCILKSFNKKETADVAFELGGEHTATFYAHRLILGYNSQMLADMCKPGDLTPVSIANVAPEVFKIVLYFCYGGKIGEDDMKTKSKQIIDAADRFGIVPLKLAAEASYVEMTEFSAENVVEILAYADARNLALLKG